jgi:hypothetical protein
VRDRHFGDHTGHLERVAFVDDQKPTFHAGNRPGLSIYFIDQLQGIGKANGLPNDLPPPVGQRITQENDGGLVGTDGWHILRITHRV